MLFIPTILLQVVLNFQIHLKELFHSSDVPTPTVFLSSQCHKSALSTDRRSLSTSQNSHSSTNNLRYTTIDQPTLHTQLLHCHSPAKRLSGCSYCTYHPGNQGKMQTHSYPYVSMSYLLIVAYQHTRYPPSYMSGRSRPWFSRLREDLSLRLAGRIVSWEKRDQESAGQE